MNKKVLNIIIIVVFIIIILFLGFNIKSSKVNNNSSILSSQIDEKESKIEELDKELISEKEKLSKLQEEYNEYKDNNAESDISSLKKEIENKTNMIAELNKELDQLKNNNNSSSKTEKETNVEKITELENKIKELTESKEELENELLTKTNTINELNSETSTNITNLENQILTKINKITELEKQIEELKNSYLVIYVADSNIVKTLNVQKGKNVTNIPDVPNKTGYTGTWSSNGTNITEDTIIFAEYTVKTYNIYYKLDFGRFNEINIAEFKIDGTKYVYLEDYGAVFKLGDDINPDNSNPFEIDNEEFTYSGDHVTKTSNSQDYYGVAYGTYFVFYYNDQMYILNINYKNLYPCTMYNVRTDYVFEVDNKHYKFGGDEFNIYSDDSSYEIERMYFILGGYYYYVENNKVYDSNENEVTNVVNNKFTLEIEEVNHEYTLDPHYPGANEISAVGTFKDRSILTTTYKYGDRIIKLPNIDSAVNDINSPRYASPRSWVVKLLKSNNELYLLEETYGDIYIYIDWNIPS